MCEGMHAPQVTHLPVPEGERLRKLLALRAAQGGLSAGDEKELKGLRRRLEMEVLEAADVVGLGGIGGRGVRMLKRWGDGTRAQGSAAGVA
jgi:regulator of nonsense transcripts 1